MSEDLLVGLILASMALAFVLGIWIGLGYPGLYDRHEGTSSRVPRKSPYRVLLDRAGEWTRSALHRAAEKLFGD